MKSSLKTASKVFFLYMALAMFVSCSKSSDDNPDPDPDPGPNPMLGNILMFISKEQTYYSEYKITLEALQAAGYTVDVRSAGTGTADVYTFSGDIDDNNNQTSGATYNDFTTQFQASFGEAWNPAWNATPGSVPLDGRIQDVADMTSYDALVIPGGSGALAYRLDNTYEAQGDVNAEEVQAAAEKLNELAIEALSAGKPVMALCHGASIPAFFRVPGTSNSLLQGQYATGFPLPEPGIDDTATALANLGVNYRAEDRVTISSPNTAFNDNAMGDYKIITTRDWYSQSVAHGVRTLLNVLDSYPSKAQLENTIDVLILHGGEVDPGDCGTGNKANDVPCNHGGGADLPADFTHLRDLLLANSPSDNFDINISELNLFDEIPTYNELSQYDAVVFFKHWASGVTTALQNALIDYADDGGGVVALHHAVYNAPEGELNKDLLVNQLFGIVSGVGVDVSNAALRNYNLFAVNYGHFVSTYGISLAGTSSLEAPGSWSGNAPDAAANLSFSSYQNFGIYDELYNNIIFTSGQTLGRAVNEITPLFSNNVNGFPNPVSHTSGFVKLYNPSGDGSIGRVAFFQPGERRESMTVNHRYGQVIRNAVVWAAQGN